MEEVLNLDNLMGPNIKGGYPGPTLAELVKSGFEKFGSFAIKRDDESKVVETYKRELGKEYYLPSTVREYDQYADGIARRLKKLRVARNG